MARKKKANANEKDLLVGGISYRGDVKIELIKDGKVVKTRGSHNTGMMPLFQHLANCLIGNFSTNSVPCLIRVFKLSSTDPFTIEKECTTTTIPVVSSRVAAIQDGYQTIMTFTIPGAGILYASEANACAIYSLENKNDRSQPSAFYHNAGGLGLVADYNVRITWTMTVKDAAAQ